MEVRRGEVWWAKMPLPAGRRPVILMSRDAAYAVRAAVTVVELSTRVRGIPSEVPLTTRDGLPRRCVANADNLVTMPKVWLESRICALRVEKVSAVEDAVLFALGIGR